MLNGFSERGELKGVKVTENGELLIKINGENKATIDNTSENPVPVAINNIETTLYAGTMTLNTTEQTIGVNKNVTELSIANYSETANVIVSVDETTNFTIAPNLALDIPINKNVAIIGLSATESDTKIQYVIKGEA